MVDIEKKIQILEDSAVKSANKDAEILGEKINNIAQEKISEKLDNYRDFLAEKYEKEVNKIIRDYNKRIFDYEKNDKMKIINFKQNLVSNINSKVKEKLTIFVNSYEYKEYLFKNISDTLRKVHSENSFCKVCIVERDYYQFKNEILNVFNIELDKIDNINIGGCIAENRNAKISVNNTIKNNLEENINKYYSAL